MSRLAKLPLEVPSNVKVAIDGRTISMEGPKGKLDLKVQRGVKVEQKDHGLLVDRTSNEKQARANQGTVRAHLKNMIIGLTDGHKRDLEIQGIGFRAQLQGKKITFNLGLSHPVEFEVPEDVEVKVPSQTNISIEGADNIKVGQVAARIKAIKPVEPYKGKGIRYVGQSVRRKQGKSVAK